MTTRESLTAEEYARAEFIRQAVETAPVPSPAVLERLRHLLPPVAAVVAASFAVLALSLAPTAMDSPRWDSPEARPGLVLTGPAPTTPTTIRGAAR